MATDIDVPVTQDITEEAKLAKRSTGLGLGFKTTSMDSELEKIEDHDLYEILWKQDADLGVPRDLFFTDEEAVASIAENVSGLKKDLVLAEKKEKETAGKGENFKDATSFSNEDSWSELMYAVDEETGEYVLKEDELLGVAALLPSANEVLDDGTVGTIDETLCSLSFSGQNFSRESSTSQESPLNPPEEELSSAQLLDTGTQKEARVRTIKEELEASLRDMIQTTQYHSRSNTQVRMPLLRTISMEQRWQDLANFLSLPSGDASANLIHHPTLPPHHHPHHAAHHFAHPYPHHHPHPQSHHHHTPIHSHHPYGLQAAHHSHPYGSLPASAAYTSADGNRHLLLQNSALTNSLADLGNNGSYPPTLAGSGVSLGSAVTASMNVGNNTEPLETAGHNTYKVEGPSEMLYYQQHASASEVNPSGDGFFTSILNDEDLQLMDMAINDGMYPMRMMDGQGSATVISAASNPTPAGPPTASAVLDGASDSAVSSMGSERVPSISDNDWIESQGTDSSNAAGAPGSSGHPHAPYGMDYSAGAKYRGYDFGYGGRSTDLLGRGGPQGTTPPVAQKKHQMFGKRTLSEHGPPIPDPSLIGGVVSTTPASPATSLHKYDYSNVAGPGGGPLYSHPIPPNILEGSSGLHPLEMKYGSPMDFNHHPHDIRGMEHIHQNSYTFRSESGGTQRPLARDKHRGPSSVRHNSESSMGPGASGSGSGSESEGSSRDEKRARAMNIPLTIDEIINLPMDEFNERLSKYDLSEAQLSLIRDIRRRGKNKVAAQNCRKRKLDQILSLADEVKRVRERRLRLSKEREYLLAEKARIKEKFALLYRHVFQSLRDADGQPYSPYEYSLQQSADGSILLVPRSAPHGSTPIDPEVSHPAVMDPSMIPGASGLYLGARRKTPDHKLD